MTIPVILTSRTYNPSLGQFITTYTEVVATFQAAVATQAYLPLIGNTLYDARITLDDNYLHCWNGTAWISIGESDVYDYVVNESIPGTVGTPALVFKESVANQAALPPSGNSLNDARITNDTGHLYIWDGTQWVDQGDIIDFQWSAIEDRPSSPVANIDDAVLKRHTQGTDQGLDTGGVNATTATQIKSAVDSKHAAHSDDQDLSGKVDKVTGSSLVPDTEITKIHSQNTDLYLNTQTTHKLYVDGNRTDTYVEDGSFTKPFKKIQDAIDAATGATIYNRITIQIMPGLYVEQIVMKQWVHLVSLVPDSVWIQSDVGDVVTTSVDANMTNLGITYTGTDNTKIGLRCNNGAVIVTRETNIYAPYTGIVLENGAIFIAYGGGTLTGEADSFIVRNGAYAAFYGTVLSGWGDPYYDLTIEAGGYVDVMDVQLYNERLNNLGTLNLVTPASRIKNTPIGNIVATDVQAAINELDTEKLAKDSEIAIKLYSQNSEPTLSADNTLAIWIDTDDSNRVYLLYRRGTGDQVAVELA